ncbi:MAG: S8 family serine peptidase [Wenzhouxiangella sp.]
MSKQSTSFLGALHRRAMPGRACALALLAAVLLLAGPVQAASDEARFGSRWIVELADAPTLEFTGSDAALQSVGGVNRSAFLATAPGPDDGGRFDAQAPHVQAYAQFLKQTQADFLTQAQDLLGRKLRAEGTVLHVANAVILSISADEAERLRGLPGVKRIERERLYRLQLSAGPNMIGAPALQRGENQLPPVSGEGIVVGIIDSGINWNHRAFSDQPSDNGGFNIQNPRGRQFGLCSRADVPCNNKLIGVFDFTDSSTNGLDTDGHGTHVAAIAAGNIWAPGQSGVAPRANLISYRVCVEQDPDDPDAGTCQGSAILQALDQAVADGVDVVNFSIGSESRNPWQNVTATRILNMRAAGIPFVTSAGNSGPGADTVGWPAEAPWVMAVGSTTHTQRTGNQLQMLGVRSWLMVYGDGAGPTAGLSNLTLIAGDSVGGSLRGCTPFPANAFANRVALLERGDCLFADKVNNARAAGALAVVMINNVPGDPIRMGGLEPNGIPAGMVSQQAGQEIRGLLASNSGVRQVSLPTQVSVVSGDPDVISDFSSRGRAVTSPNLMKPNVMAPGSFIRAAWIPGTGEVAALSGTSMASPHVAGAIALLRQLNPNLNPSMAYSILETTAETAPLSSAEGTPDIFDRGAGRIRADLAARAGLFLGVSRADFVAANPATGGVPRNLNLAGLVDEDCGNACTFSRRVTAIRSGSWTVSGEGEVGVSVSPSSFSLQAGETQQLTITVTPAASGSSALQHGAVVLRPATGSQTGPGPSLVAQRLPIGVRSSSGVVSLPELLRIDANANRGRQRLNLGFVDQLNEASFPTSALVGPDVENFTLPQDPNPNNPYDRSAGTRTFLIDVPAGTLALWAETTASSAPDIDLFVGRDDNGDGLASQGEERCRSITPDELERCVISNPQPGRWWVVVQNWQSSSPSASDSVRLELAVLDRSEDVGLTAFGSGRHPGGALGLDVAWDVPGLARGQRLLGAIGVSGRTDQLAEVGVVPVVLRRDVALQPITTAMFPGETQTIAVPANGRHDRLFVDVPASATSLSVQVQGEAGVSGSLRRLPFAAIRDAAPASPAASGASLANGSNSAAGFNLNLSANLQPGRYFIDLANSSASERTVSVTIALEESGAVVPRFGIWNPEGSASNPRDIAQGIEWQRAGDGFMIWYSFDADGVPVFFTGRAPLSADSSVWVTDVTRFTRGAAGQQVPEFVGTVGVTAINEEELVFSWRVNGGHGSDVMINPHSATCPVVDGQPQSLTGTWFTPGQDQGGSSVIVTGNAQGHIRYYFDGRGFGRWVLATDGGNNPLAEEIDVLDFRGFCPNCDPVAVTSAVVGSYFRRYASEDQGEERLEFVSRAPLNEVVTLEVPIRKLSDRLACP